MSDQDLLGVILLLLTCFSGVYAIYRLNDFIDSEWNLRNNLRFFFKERNHVFFTLIFAGVIIPLALIYLPWTTFVLLGISGLIGALYSLKFTYNTRIFRIKNTFILKNLSIGLVWGNLVLIGVGNLNQPMIIEIFIFTCLQVFIGSVIRDIPDIEKDRSSKVQTLPIVLGVPKTLVLLQILNMLSLLVCLGGYPIQLLIIVVPAVLWRALTLVILRKNENSVLWGQYANLFTCTLIFLSLLIVHLIYDHGTI